MEDGLDADAGNFFEATSIFSNVINFTLLVLHCGSKKRANFGGL